MVERRQIIERWQQGAGSTLITLVRVEGSSYRHTGARLLVCKDGSSVGSVSAGCLEAELLRKAAWLVREGATVARYSTVFDEDSEIPFGLGCGGVLDLLVEPVDTAECQALMQAFDSSLAGEESLVVTWLPEDGRVLARAIYRHDRTPRFTSKGLSSAEISRELDSMMPSLGSNGGSVFLESLEAPQRLFVFGAGNDAKPLVSTASLLGWNVVIVDGRSNLATTDRFPDPLVRVCATPETLVKEITARDAVVIMTHSFEQDRDALTAVIPVKPRYLGLLGSRQRSSFLISEVAARLGLLVSDCSERVKAPIGLDIGGDGAEAIALAIMAEAQACCNGKDSPSRKLSAKDIRQYLAESEPQEIYPTHCGLGAE